MWWRKGRFSPRSGPATWRAPASTWSKMSRCARRVRERDAVGRKSAVLDFKRAADRLNQRPFVEELRDRELADGQDKLRSQERELALQPCAATGDLVRRRHTIAADRPFAGKA